MLENTENTQVVLTLAYQAPAVEAVLTAEDLDREVHYAGVLSCIQCGMS